MVALPVVALPAAAASPRGRVSRGASVGLVERISTAAALDALLDSGSWQPWDTPGWLPADLEYAKQLARAAQRSGSDESIRTGGGTIGGAPVAVVAGDFDFLAGSVGVAAAERLVGAIQRATAERLPLIGLPTSGGTRMQEGTPAFLRMVPIAAAVAAHRDAGLPYLVWLRDPTLGGVMATWGSLGQVTAAAPGATVGFLGARVFATLNPGEQFPAEVQSAEHACAVGVIDAVVPLGDLRGWFATLLTAITAKRDLARPSALPSGRPPSGRPPSGRPSELPDELPDAWACVTATRDPRRPGARELVAAAATDITVLHGTGEGERGDALMLAVARIDGRGCVIAAQDRAATEPLGPAALRTARRGYRLAREWGLPLVTVVDTEGAEVSAAAEERAMAGEIARNLAELSRLDMPVVSVLLGSGCGGGALAMLPADAVLAADDAWITPLPPEGAAAILYRTVDKAPEMARTQHITAVELTHHGVVDQLLPGLSMADQTSAAAFVASAAAALGEALSSVQPSQRRVERFIGAADVLGLST